MKVLVIDDEQDIRLVAQVGLRAAGMSVLVAESGADGVRVAQTEQPDVILLDVMMPGLDGFATFSALKTDADTAAIPVIFLTAKDPSGRETQTRTEGAAGFIMKPFQPRDLPVQLKTILGI